MTSTTGGSVLWIPNQRRVDEAEFTHYRAWLAEQGLVDADSYGAVWEWSVRDPDGFWASLWDYFGVVPRRRGMPVLAPDAMPGAGWFAGESLNYAANALRHPADAAALICRDETGVRSRLSYGDLRQRVAAAAIAFTESGVQPGDRVAAVLPNVEETVVAFLAVASIGAIWTLCSPEFGESSIVARVAQTEPTILITVDAYRYGGRVFDVREKLRAVRSRLPSARAHVEVRSGLVEADAAAPQDWDAFVSVASSAEFTPAAVDFAHPLWILFSSGTTGIPKAMVHGHGGIVLEHLKSLALHNDLKPGDILFWYTSTAWMMWNYLVGTLLRGATAVLYDGIAAPDLLWSLAGEDAVTHFGASPGFYQQSLDQKAIPGDLVALRTLGSTGSPLLDETHRRLTEALPKVHVASVSGGTDVCSGFVGPSPVLPVTVGRMQCRMLGVDCAAFDADGNEVVEEIGELVVRRPMPSMPLRLWNDPEGVRYQNTYFSRYPGVWCHGDWIEFTRGGEAIITGRSDATLNRGGVRMGTSEFYRVLQEIPWTRDALIVDCTTPEAPAGSLVLFVVTDDGEMPEERRTELEATIRAEISPRHVPDIIVAVAEVPYTLTGKKCEIPVKRMLLGAAASDVADPESLRNPAALGDVVAAARTQMGEE